MLTDTINAGICEFENLKLDFFSWLYCPFCVCVILSIISAVPLCDIGYFVYSSAQRCAQGNLDIITSSPLLTE